MFTCAGRTELITPCVLFDLKPGGGVFRSPGFSFKSALQKRCKPVVVVVFFGDHIGGGLCPIGPVLHGYTQAGGPYHVDVILLIPGGNRTVCGYSQIITEFFECCALSYSFGYDFQIERGGVHECQLFAYEIEQLDPEKLELFRIFKLNGNALSWL